MTAVTGLDAVDAEPSVVTIGNFDGVHRGHLTLLHRTVGAATDSGLRSVAVTFDPHPAAVLRPGSEPLMLQTLEQRVEALEDAGVDLVVVLPFTTELAALQPEAFIQRVLAEGIGAVRVVVGTNFRFGHRAAGDIVALAEAGDRFGYGVEAVGLLELDEAAVSSTSIRTAVTHGEVVRAALDLGRPFALRGQVVEGDGRGRTIGIPTANLDVNPGVVVPASGVYAGRASVDGETYDAVVNIGVRPTFDGRTTTVEVHLLDAEVALYGRTLTVTFEQRLRGEQRFDGPEQLVAQIHQDIAQARSLLKAPAG